MGSQLFKPPNPTPTPLSNRLPPPRQLPPRAGLPPLAPPIRTAGGATASATPTTLQRPKKPLSSLLPGPTAAAAAAPTVLKLGRLNAPTTAGGRLVKDTTPMADDSGMLMPSTGPHAAAAKAAAKKAPLAAAALLLRPPKHRAGGGGAVAASALAAVFGAGKQKRPAAAAEEDLEEDTIEDTQQAARAAAAAVAAADAREPKRQRLLPAVAPQDILSPGSSRGTDTELESGGGHQSLLEQLAALGGGGGGGRAARALPALPTLGGAMPQGAGAAPTPREVSLVKTAEVTKKLAFTAEAGPAKQHGRLLPSLSLGGFGSGAGAAGATKAAAGRARGKGAGSRGGQRAQRGAAAFGGGAMSEDEDDEEGGQDLADQLGQLLGNALGGGDR